MQDYIVYVDPNIKSNREANLKFLQQVIEGSSSTPAKSLVYSYKGNAINGFAASLTDREANYLERVKGIVAVLPSQTYDFLDNGSGYGAPVEAESNVDYGVVDGPLII
ncbi:hypothetical protein QYF36_002729 [Acer negundo]|nr:hypothetical protein QYF36_002729 [Acer negundo]